MEQAVDAVVLGRWLVEQGVVDSGVLDVQPLGEGHSNLTFRVAAGDRSLVLRRPPLGPLLPTAHDVIREFRVLSLLQGSGVRVPCVVAACEDDSVLGAPFYLMESAEGVVIRAELPAWLREGGEAPARQRALGLDVVDSLAEIHGADWQPLVAAGIGKPSGYLERQVRRWVGQREGIQAAVAAAGAQARDLPDYDVVRDWLRAHLPDEQAPAIVHGDFKLDNVIVEQSGDGTPRVTAVLDWEMATVGDPRADLGYLMSMWSQPGESTFFADLMAAGDHLPSRDDLAARWSTRTGRDIGDVTWFQVLAVWKLAILLEASYYRWLAGTTTDPFFARLEAGVPSLLREARSLAGAR